jgi:carbamoyl-phosphate synthase small subunit
MGRKPIFGICLGHQLDGIALGGKTFKLKFGHHGGNHPVKQLKTGKIEITAHNHNFAVDPDSLAESEVELTHIDLNDSDAGRPAASEPAAVQRAVSPGSRAGAA